MNKLNIKAISTALSIVVASTVSLSAQAEQVSIEQAVTQFVVAQGSELMNDLSVQLHQSISQELSKFSIDAATQWFSDSTQVAVQEKQKQLSETQKSTDVE